MSSHRVLTSPPHCPSYSAIFAPAPAKKTPHPPPQATQRTQRQPDSAPGLLDNCPIRTQRRITYIMYSFARRQNTVNTTTCAESRAFCQDFTVDKYTHVDRIVIGAIKKRLKRNAKTWHNGATKRKHPPTIKTSRTSGTAGTTSGTTCHQHQPVKKSPISALLLKTGVCWYLFYKTAKCI